MSDEQRIETLEAWINRHGLTRVKTAAVLGVSRNALAVWLRGDGVIAEPTWRLIEVLASNDTIHYAMMGTYVDWARGNTPWTDLEDARMAALREGGMSWKDVAREMGRSVASVRSRASKGRVAARA